MSDKIAKALLHLYPNEDPLRAWEVHDKADGNGPYLAKWNLPGPRPTQAQIDQGYAGYQAAQAQEKINRKNRKRSARQALANGSFNVGNARGLKELLEDLNED